MKPQTQTIVTIAEMLLRQIEEARAAEDPVVYQNFIHFHRACDSFVQKMNRSCVCCASWQNECQMQVPHWTNYCKEFRKKENKK